VHDRVLLYLNLLAAAVIDAAIALGLALQGPDVVAGHAVEAAIVLAALPLLLGAVVHQHRRLVAVMA
jgi:hypothetical protein